MNPTDILLGLGLSILLLAYAQRIDTRQSIATVAGFIVLAIGKRLEIAQGSKTDDTVRRVKQLGYSILLFAPSYTHWYDLLGVIGYVYCFFAEYNASIAPLAAYYILGAQGTTSTLSKLGRTMLGFAMMMGFKSPLQ